MRDFISRVLLRSPGLLRSLPLHPLQILLRLGYAERGRLLEPFTCELVAAGNAASVAVERAQIVHGLAVAKRNRLLEPVARLAIVALHAGALQIHQAHIVDRR